MMRVAKVTELIGSSPKGWEDAAREAVRRAAKTLTGITGFKILRRQVAVLPSGKSEYRVRLRLIFEVAPDFDLHE